MSGGGVCMRAWCLRELVPGGGTGVWGNWCLGTRGDVVRLLMIIDAPHDAHQIYQVFRSLL
ncbi:hypothetical protein O7U_01207 [Bartonella quintana JK 68]|uniref:Uncharacterized protein n=2 Tax=Bartonella quintana TaxID=803 RepID=A0ABR4SNG4_BARQI|nr:hypothetical protein O93_01204 [Bartonella quintana JK 19]KEC64735.1 hypothetical protein O7U_01207 [Bartonella quintana JK 68]KEC66724.1 hypothetical protein O7S_00858 [Bartonella quintana JK 67]KEC69162.1 hypothetical protein O7Q_00107 [Bartonella quintana JK 39]